MAPSAQLQRAQAAVKAMKLIGFDQAKAKTVLKNLLKVYENNWEYIEAENYRLLADSILDYQESADPEGIGTASAASDAPESSHKRSRRSQEDSGHLPLATGAVASGQTSLKRPKLVRSPEQPPTSFSGKMIERMEAHCFHEGKGIYLSPPLILKNGPTRDIIPRHSYSCQELRPVSDGLAPRVTRSNYSADVPYLENEKSGSLVIHERDKHQPSDTSRTLVCYEEPKIEPDNEVFEDIISVGFSSIPDMSADQVPFHISDSNDRPISLLPPHGIPSRIAGDLGKAQNGDFHWANASTGLAGANVHEAPTNENEIESPKKSVQKETIYELSSLPERFSANTDTASSNKGEVKLSLTYSSHCPNFKMPSLELVFKMVEDRCLKSYKILQPDFSLMNLMKEICQCTMDLATESSRDELQKAINHSSDIQEKNVLEASQSFAIIPQQEHTVCAPHPPHDENDIAKGEERVRISLINEFTSEKFPAYFHYIPRNAVYQNAHVNFSLARIDDEDCCLNCFGDCLSAPIPCACTRETGGEFAYTLDGLLKKEFLNDCISMNRDPDKHHHIYCKDCPIEKSKNEHMPDACKGHLVRKFIKECWSKCGCSKRCGNRIVQRGISRNLQVFFAADGKGWGLRTLEELPRGAFVCEYVGEILTNIELYDRTIQKTGGARHTYPVLLDADWGSEAGLRDEEALCLDATFYGNVGRFVNHRCFDANLVEVPVEWETPDHHYYHLAFFTTRKVEAMEELAWDYGIDFEDHSHPIKAFKCLCGSRFCRDRVRSKARSRASGSR